LFERDPYRVPITDFFGSVRRVEVSDNTVNLTSIPDSGTKSVEHSDSKQKFSFGDLLPIDTLLKETKI